MLVALGSISKSSSCVLRVSSTRFSSFFPFFHWHIPFFLLTLILRGFTNDVLIWRRISASKKSCQVTLELLFLSVLFYSKIQLHSSYLHIYFLNENKYSNQHVYLNVTRESPKNTYCFWKLKTHVKFVLFQSSFSCCFLLRNDSGNN